VYYGLASNLWSAIVPEKEIKKWGREKNNKLLKAFNPEMERFQFRMIL